jgi:transposase-like protein
MNQLSTVERPRRREYSAEFKASVLEQSRRPGASLAGVALAHAINPNMVHRWIRECWIEMGGGFNLIRWYSWPEYVPRKLAIIFNFGFCGF